MPALRQRREDIPLLAQFFVRKSCHDNGIPEKQLSQDALRVLMTYDWPGNIRQLENAVEHAVAMSVMSKDIGAAALPLDIREGTDFRAASDVSIPEEGLNFTSVVSQLERELILRCLRTDRRQQAPGGATASVQPHDVHRQDAAAQYQ